MTTELRATELRIDLRSGERRAHLERRNAVEPAFARPDLEAPAPERRKAAPRRKVERRRQIDPTTCERDYSGEEVAFMRAMDDYKRKSGRMFPTWSEVLEVIRSLGYRQVAEPQALADFKKG